MSTLSAAAGLDVNWLSDCLVSISDWLIDDDARWYYLPKWWLLLWRQSHSFRQQWDHSWGARWRHGYELWSSKSPVPDLSHQATRILAAWYLLRQDAPNYPAINFDAFRPDDDSVNQHIDVQADHDKVVREIGAASIVLLKNKKGALPLKKPRSLVLIGSDAGPGHAGPNEFPDHGGLDGVLYMGWGSGTANLTYLITVCTFAFESWLPWLCLASWSDSKACERRPYECFLVFRWLQPR